LILTDVGVASAIEGSQSVSELLFSM